MATLSALASSLPFRRARTSRCSSGGPWGQCRSMIGRPPQDLLNAYAERFLRGRPPLAPFSFAAVASALVRRCPPSRPAAAANKRVPNAPVGSFSNIAGRRRPARYGLLVQFESRPADPELGRLVDSTLWINDAHPAYTRAAASRSTGYHLALSVALALAPLAIGAEGEHAFITQFLAHWGDASGEKPRRRRRRR